jgi:hypothetical protein
MQEAVLQPGQIHIQTVCKDERANKPPTGNASMKKGRIRPTGGVLLACDRQLPTFQRNVQLFAGEARYRQGDADRSFARLFNIIRRIAVGGGPRGAINQGASVIKTQQKWAVELNRTRGHRYLAPELAATMIAPQWRQGDL